MAILFQPHGALLRWSSTLILGSAGAICFFCYWFINFRLCIELTCDSEAINMYVVRLSEFYIYFGVGMLMIAAYYVYDKSVPRIFNVGITYGVSSGFVLAIKPVFALGVELSANA